MDIVPTPPSTSTTTATAAATTTVKTPDPNSEQPLSTTKHLPPHLTNGILKRHKPLNHHQPPSPPLVVTYKECLKNHAATIGGHAIDGCGEFMPSPTSSPSYPTSLKCAACGCHRNFHRREPEESNFPPPIQHLIEYQPHHRHHPPPPPTTGSPDNSPSPPPISSSYYPSSAPHMLLALSTGLSSENHLNNHSPAIPTTPGSGGTNPNGKKRYRTKFTQEQKEKMQKIAEKVGWKMQKRDEELIIGFCNQIGVDKNVFKVWMHNNKTIANKDSTNCININNNNNGNDNININNNNNNNNNGSDHQDIDFSSSISRNSNGVVDHKLHLHNGGGDSFGTTGNVISSSSC